MDQNNTVYIALIADTVLDGIFVLSHDPGMEDCDSLTPLANNNFAQSVATNFAYQISIIKQYKSYKC